MAETPEVKQNLVAMLREAPNGALVGAEDSKRIDGASIQIGRKG